MIGNESVAIAALLNLVMLLIFFDSALWSIVLLRHSFWMKKHRDADNRCHKISWTVLATAATMTGLFVVVLGMAWIWFKVNHGYNLAVYSLFIGMHLAIIHLFALIAHCTMLDIAYWPSLSKIKSIHIVQPIRKMMGKKTNTPPQQQDVSHP